MPVINTEAARKADALLEDQKQDWYRAHQIAILKTLDERKAALEQLEIETDHEYAEHIKSMVAPVFANRKAKREASLKNATTALRETFSKGKQRKKMTARASHATTKSNVAQLINKLEQGATAGVNL